MPLKGNGNSGYNFTERSAICLAHITTYSVSKKHMVPIISYVEGMIFPRSILKYSLWDYCHLVDLKGYHRFLKRCAPDSVCKFDLFANK